MGGESFACRYDLLSGAVIWLALYHFYHVIYDMAVLLLRAEHYNLRVFCHTNIMARWPVKQIIRIDCFLCAGRVCCRELAAYDEAPVWTLTQITIQSLEQRSGINACREAEVLATDLA